jgi:predicted Zn-dependent peptidase
MLLSAKLDKLVERERQIIIDEFYKNYPAQFRYDLDLRKHKVLYAGYWLERFVRPLGTPESVGRITPRDLQAYYDAHYTPANMSVVGVGGMTLRELVELLRESPFAVKKQGTRTSLPMQTTKLAPPSETHYVFQWSQHLTLVEPLKVGVYQSFAKFPGNASGRAVRIVSSMFDEVLNEEVREQRTWTYGIGSSHAYHRHFYDFAISCPALALHALDEIEAVVEGCIATMKDREDLFELAKRRALAGNFMVDSTGRGICGRAVDTLAEEQRIVSLAEYDQEIKRVTMDEIRTLLEWLRPERRWTLIMRP